MVELLGPLGCGQRSLTLMAMAQALRQHRFVAWIDPQQTFDPKAARQTGVPLKHLLWIRPEERHALKVADRLIQIGALLWLLFHWVATHPRPNLYVDAPQTKRRAT